MNESSRPLLQVRDLKTRFQAPGDFAQAYVIAHEVGHHVQNLLGISDEVHRLRSRSSRARANALSVLQELQADCLAGVWGHSTAQRGILDLSQAVTETVPLEAGVINQALDRLERFGGDVRVVITP